MSACTNIQQPTQPTLEESMRARFDSIVDEVNRNPVPGSSITRSAKYVETIYSGDSLCILHYSVLIEGKRHIMEFVYAYPISEYKDRSEIHLWTHFIDSVVSGDITRGVPLSDMLNLDSEEDVIKARKIEDLQPLF